MKEIHRLRGFPKLIVSYKDPKFIGNFWKYLWKIRGTLTMSSTYHPQIDGQIGIVNKCLEGYLLCYFSYKKYQWIKWLPLVEWWYNTTYHTTSHMSPFESLCGYPTSSITSFCRKNPKYKK
jgi:hypothetical protein